MRQGGLALETAWRTQSWASRVVATVLGIVETDAYLLYKKFHPGSTKPSHADFTEAVAKGLILLKSVGTQAACRRLESDTEALPHIIILPLSTLPIYNKDSEQCTLHLLAGYAIYVSSLARIIVILAQTHQRARSLLCVDYSQNKAAHV